MNAIPHFTSLPQVRQGFSYIKFFFKLVHDHYAHLGNERAVIIVKRSGKHGMQMKVEETIGERVDDKEERCKSSLV